MDDKDWIGEKKLLTLGEAVEHFRLSRRKFKAFIDQAEKSGNAKFIMHYSNRPFIKRREFAEVLMEHSELRRRE